ncbi:hypothetical protein AGABI1DRAFT_122610 [Agaricus bisporus var. burnettii JB137-S8]|uniref:Restriction endonuclease type IV Mrr domain-containing protein n=1 Tax=Agaricus bisporus var. burnettii (strain JB137-S8 / ATCC MYA-4627 / FGSC 10392) TaxID=597362 RepID=K5X0M8_AGABU|nr:uncharacterized protein AGABI1DRAFT_122610 [Agaricus bisporus var. burnettii JB137-S8]EKM76447.1 hypothetical protein AGABI1DRAFT_122610 [Agaricus bisporus var. burnettii JB137-S8]
MHNQRTLHRSYCVAESQPTLSNVHRGVNFETRSIGLLAEHLSMSLERVGGKGDGGVDMLGWWWIPDLSANMPSVNKRRRIRVLAQCKAEKRKIGPKYLRELEGVLYRHHTIDLLKESRGVVSSNLDGPSQPTSLQDPEPVQLPALGVFISESPFTQAAILHAQSSSIPLFLLHLPPEEEELFIGTSESLFATLVWNRALAGNNGLLGGQMEVRWERSGSGPPRLTLWWQNIRLPNWIPPKGDDHS